jgi:hypothetical protein
MPYKFNPFTGTFDDSTPGPAGVVAAANSGTALLPGITFASDPNTGIYNPGADQLAVATNGTGRLFITSAGLVGIGTSAPSSLLSVSSEANGDGVLVQRRSTTTDDYAQIGFAITTATTPGQSSWIRAIRKGVGSDALALGTGNTERLYITSGGSVGIGVTSPLGNLHLHSSTSGTGPILNLTNDTGDCRVFFGQNTSVGSANAAGQIRYSVANNTMAFYTNLNERARIAFLIHTTRPALQMQVQFKPKITELEALFLLASTQPATIESDFYPMAGAYFAGNVGIGTTSPTSPLHVRSGGSGTVALFGDSAANNTLAVTRLTTGPADIALSALPRLARVLRRSGFEG